jgi:hypothetical protein
VTVSENVVIPWSVHVVIPAQSFISVCVLIRILKSPGSLVFCGNNTGSIKDDPYWTSRVNSLELIELSSINKVSLV